MRIAIVFVFSHDVLKKARAKKRKQENWKTCKRTFSKSTTPKSMHEGHETTKIIRA